MVKHADAERVDIRLSENTEGITVTVSDDGVGFPPSTLKAGYASTSGFGLYSISERLQHIGGSLSVLSTPGEGSTVTVSIPPGDGALNTEPGGPEGGA